MYHPPSRSPKEYDPQLPWGAGEHPRRDGIMFWIWMTPVYLGVAGFILYVLYALGII